MSFHSCFFENACICSDSCFLDVVTALYIISRGALYQHSEQSAHITDLSPSPSVYLSVCLSVRKGYYGKTADMIRMPFGVVSGVGRGMDVLDGGGDRRREGQFWG